MRKKLVVLITIILSLSMMLVGCKIESPTDVVNSYFTQLKNGDSEQANEFIENAISQSEEETSDQTKEETEETDEIMEEAFKLYLSKIDVKVLSEEVDGDNAAVEVEINGPNFSNMMMEVIQEALADAFSGKEMDDDYMSRSFLEKVKSSKNEVRTGKVNLTKEDKQWKIKSDDDVTNLMLGKVSTQDSSLSK